MLPRRFNTFGTRLDLELRAFLAFTVANTLKRDPLSLPPMTDVQLWRSFLLAVTKINPYTDTPPALVAPLNPGDFFAIEAGRELRTSAYPEGESIDGIIDKAKALAHKQLECDTDDLIQTFTLTGLYLGKVPNILEYIEHPQAASFRKHLNESSEPMTDEEVDTFIRLCERRIAEMREV